MALPSNYRHSMMTSSLHSPSSQRSRTSGGLNSKEANVNPFGPSLANPSFSPQRVGTKPTASQPVLLRPPKGPEKPLMPYMRYSKSVWDAVKQQNQHLKLWEIGRIIGSMWRDLPESEKQVFTQEYDSEKVDYERAVREYHSSPPYQAYLNAKNKAAEEQVSHVVDTKPPSTTVSKGLDRRVEIQPAEDEEDQEDQLSVKQVAHSRYLRNHRLINDIFSDTIVPDVRTVVTAPRMQLLKRQVHSLTMHQKKLEGELQQIEEKFEAKKRKFEESTETYNEELKKLCEKKVDDTIFQEMLKRQTEILQKEREEQERQQQQHEEEEAEKLKEQKQQQQSIEEQEKVDNIERQHQVPENQQTSPNAVAENASDSTTYASDSNKNVTAYPSSQTEPVAMETEPACPSSVDDQVGSMVEPSSDNMDQLPSSSAQQLQSGDTHQLPPDNLNQFQTGNTDELPSGNAEQLPSSNTAQLPSGNTEVPQEYEPYATSVRSESSVPEFVPASSKDTTNNSQMITDHAMTVEAENTSNNSIITQEIPQSTTTAEISSANDDVTTAVAMETEQAEASSTNVQLSAPLPDQQQCDNIPADGVSAVDEQPVISSEVYTQQQQQQQQASGDEMLQQQQQETHQPDSTSTSISDEDQQQQQQKSENVAETETELASTSETQRSASLAETPESADVHQQPVESTTGGEPTVGESPQSVTEGVDSVTSGEPIGSITDDVTMAE